MLAVVVVVRQLLGEGAEGRDRMASARTSSSSQQGPQGFIRRVIGCVLGAAMATGRDVGSVTCAALLSLARSTPIARA